MANRDGLKTDPWRVPLQILNFSEYTAPHLTHASCLVYTKISILTTIDETFLSTSFLNRGTNLHLSKAFEQSKKVVIMNELTYHEHFVVDTNGLNPN